MLTTITPSSTFVPAGTPVSSTPTGMNGIATVLTLPAPDPNNVQMTVQNTGEHPLQVNFGGTAVPFSYAPPGSLRVKPNKTALLTGQDAIAAASATQVSVSFSAQGCVATFTRGSLATVQAAT